MFAIGNLTLNSEKKNVNPAKIFPQIMICPQAIFSISLICIPHLIINIKTVYPGSHAKMSCGHRLTGYSAIVTLICCSLS